MPEQLRVGAGRRDITPPLGSPLMGYPNPARTAESVRDPLYATALALENDGERALVMSFDLCVPPEEVVAGIRAAAHARTGIEPARITVSFTHTHSGPNTQVCWGWCEPDLAYLEGLYPKAGEAAADAVAAARPGLLGVGTARSEVGINRRAILEDHSVGLGVCPWGVFDPEMTVLRFVSADAERQSLATLIHYGAHPTVFDGNTRRVSRDWPGVMIDRVEALTGAPALFINGALGDVAPRTNHMSAVGDGEVALQEVGNMAAMDAMRAYREVREFRPAPLSTLTRSFVLPYRPLPPLDEAQRQRAAHAAHEKGAGAGACEFKHWSAVVEAHGQPPVAGKTFEQTITAIGPVALVPLPGETFAETVLRIRQGSPYPHTLPASETNGSLGYFPTRESIHRGGYEVWVAKAFGARILAEGIDDVLVAENRKLLRELFAERTP